jgi:hypothetical protein
MDKRSTAQNRYLWAILKAFSDQLEWPVNGLMQRITPEDYKDILSASYRSESIRLSQTTDGRVVMLGLRTRYMKKPEFCEFIEFLFSVAAERGVTLPIEDFEWPQ